MMAYRSLTPLFLGMVAWVAGCAQTERARFGSPQGAVSPSGTISLSSDKLSAADLPDEESDATVSLAKTAPARTRPVAQQAAHRVVDEADVVQFVEDSEALLLYPEAASVSDDSAPHASQPAGGELERLPQAEIGLSLPALEHMAVSNNPTLVQAQELVAQAQGNWLQVGLYPNPVAGYSAAEIGQDGKAGQEGMYVAQTFVTANKLGLNRDAATWEIERARWLRSTQELRVLNDVRIRFYQALARNSHTGKDPSRPLRGKCL